MQVFVLAGGFATRLWPLTEKRAKPLLPLAGKPIISHPLEQIPASMPITVSTNATFEMSFDEWQKTTNHPNTHILIEQTEHDDHKLGALGAVAQWIRLHNVDEDVLLLTGDNYFGFQMSEFLDAYTNGTPLLAAYDIKEVELAKQFGTVILNDDNTIAAFEEKPAEPKTTLVSTGCSILPKDTLSTLVEFAESHPDNVGGIFEELLRKKWKIDCFTFENPWFDIGSFGAYLEATQTLVGNTVVLGEGAISEQNECDGSVVLGAHSTVRNSKLKNVVVFDHCTIEDCELEDCIIDNHSMLIGIDLQGKMLREKTVLKKKN